MPFRSFLSIVIPVYRSEAYLGRTVHELLRFLEPHGEFEVILVNDGSPDGVQRVVEQLSSADARVHGICLGRNWGQHRATLQGFAAARGDIVVTLDDDGQNPPEVCLSLMEVLAERDLDVVYGRFEVVQQSAARRFASRGNRWFSRLTLGNRSDITISNVRAIRGDLARKLGASESPYPYIDAMIFQMTRNIGEVSVPHRPREQGESTYRLSGLLKLWISHLTSLTILPLKIAMFGSFGISVLGFLVGTIQLARTLAESRAPAGWLSLFCALTFLFSLLFVFLGIVSAYLGRMYVTLNRHGLLWVRPQGSLRHGAVVPPSPSAIDRSNKCSE